MSDEAHIFPRKDGQWFVGRVGSGKYKTQRYFKTERQAETYADTLFKEGTIETLHWFNQDGKWLRSEARKVCRPPNASV